MTQIINLLKLAPEIQEAFLFVQRGKLKYPLSPFVHIEQPLRAQAVHSPDYLIVRTDTTDLHKLPA
ncbi:MAG TPA: hypothetical protein DD473_00790 [Planctomycetaceae bacterium]|nr:hypothetical protein [Planctomycetaceae bacterium]